MIIFGIDPGVSGAISVLENKKIISDILINGSIVPDFQNYIIDINTTKSFLGKNSPLVKGYESLIALHNLLGDMNTLMKAREKMDKMLFNGAKRVYSDYDAIQGVF